MLGRERDVEKYITTRPMPRLPSHLPYINSASTPQKKQIPSAYLSNIIPCHQHVIPPRRSRDIDLLACEACEVGIPVAYQSVVILPTSTLLVPLNLL